ncbi:dihydroxyacetone kinase [Oceanobacillus sp. E9]|uniref:dihydroxyacetone kinase subunit DhaL n=1 Tax=Oceanobacillus TaxID=182709 RepID=UPI00084E5702|nr:MULTISPECIES: dihydroxyacetone kinase subunit DhaL [Oceanobacillus]OEH55188.1 dihydroxyacetone kinase [Oceanobacillus sp. E9]
MKLQVNDIRNWMNLSNQLIQENKSYLTELDQAIGDSDHGINMARGFQEVITKIQDQSYSTPSDMLKDVAMTLMSKVGGAAGPLYGTAFLKLSMAWKNKSEIQVNDIKDGLQAGLDGIKQRGKATSGEKTMIDVWDPVVQLFSENDITDPSLIEETAKQAMNNTKDLKATKGRASYFKEKSIGNIDPGSASSYYIFSALSTSLQGA